MKCRCRFVGSLSDQRTTSDKELGKQGVKPLSEVQIGEEQNMALNLAAIFGTDSDDVTTLVVADPPSRDPFPDVAHDPAEQLTGDLGTAPLAARPIIEGTEHFSLWVDDAEGSWPEFIPGYHYDIRQPSRLRPLCSPAPNTAIE